MTINTSNILIIGGDGFIAKNLTAQLIAVGYKNINLINRNTGNDETNKLLNEAEIIVHLAGINRPLNEKDFDDNCSYTSRICSILLDQGRKTPIIFSSSTQASLDNAYGLSKKCAEDKLIDYAKKSNAMLAIYRLPGIFGKWCKPEYNSVVATFCYNISRNIPVKITDPNKYLDILYIDDLIDEFVEQINKFRLNENTSCQGYFKEIMNINRVQLIKLYEIIKGFKNERYQAITNSVSSDKLTKYLYSTYLSMIDSSEYSYDLRKHADARGIFVEFVKGNNLGQVSYFTAAPGIARGGHYHNTKVEKFLVVSGTAIFRMKNILTNEVVEFELDAKNPRVVESIPGWAHTIINTGCIELVVMLWCNEIFHPEKPDTYVFNV